MPGLLLAIEGGATHSNAVLARLVPDSDSEVAEVNPVKFSCGPANYALLKAEGLSEFLDKLKIKVEKSLKEDENVEKIAIGLPGVITADDKEVIQATVKSKWPAASTVWAGTDVQVALNCLEDDKTPVVGIWRCLIICGTGSVCYGIQGEGLRGKTIKVGGNGHVLGDRGSGYEIGLKAIRNSFMEWERSGESALFHEIMLTTKTNTVEELTKWSVSASKHDIASLANVTATLWTDFNDTAAKRIMVEAMDDLAEDFLVLIHKANPVRTDVISIGFAGSLLTECIPFAEGVRKRITEALDQRNNRYRLFVLTNTAVGALRCICREPAVAKLIVKCRQPFDTKMTGWRAVEEKRLRALVLPVKTQLPRTEERNPRSMKLDKMDLMEAVELMISEESTIYDPIRTQADKIALLIERVTKAFKNDGRLFYIGAGTSGRLGVLDASECPPTFKAPSEWVQGIIAGGQSAMFKAVEGAEDSVVGGTLAVKANDIGKDDVLVGIASSGYTPFVWGALYEAAKAGAYTAMLSFNPYLEVKLNKLDLLLTVDVGPEILTGSTRLKAGTATKTILNMITTLSMVKYGKVLENLMVDLKASNDKLRDRATRIVLTIVGQERPDLTKEAADVALQENSYDIKKTVAALRKQR